MLVSADAPRAHLTTSSHDAAPARWGVFRGGLRLAQAARAVAVSLTPRRCLVGVLLLTVAAYWVGISSVDLRLTRGHVIGSDGLFYYEYLPSFFLDGDLDFRNQRQTLISEGVPYSWGALHPSAGNLTYFSPGWAVLTAPFFLAAHGLALVGSLFWPLRLDGYGFLHESITNFGAVLYGCAGVALLFATLERWVVTGRTALTTAIAVLGTTNLAYYLVAQASMAHAVGFFAVAGSLYFFCAVERGDGRLRSALGWGAFSGLAFIVRPQLALCVAPLFAYAGLLAWQRRAPAQLARLTLRTLAVAVLAALLVSCIQLLVWERLFGRAFVVPQGSSFLKLGQPELVAVLFSLRHGLFTWHPFYSLCLLGLLFGAGPRGLRLLALSCIALQVYLNASVSDWWAGNAFGLRRFIDVLPFFAIGGALLLERLARARLALPLVGLLLVWNLLFMVQYRFGYLSRGQAITRQQLISDKFRLVLRPSSLPRGY